MLTEKQANFCYLIQTNGLVDVTINQYSASDLWKLIKKYIPKLINLGIATKVDWAEEYIIDSPKFYAAFDEWKNKNIKKYELLIEKEESELILYLF